MGPGPLTEARLAAAGAALAESRAQRHDIAARLADLVRQAHAEGMPETRIARTAGIDRMTVRRYLGKR